MLLQTFCKTQRVDLNVNQASNWNEDQGAVQQLSDARTLQSSDKVRDETRTTLSMARLWVASHCGIVMIIIYVDFNMMDKAADPMKNVLWVSLFGMVFSIFILMFSSDIRLLWPASSQWLRWLPLLNLMNMGFALAVMIYFTYVICHANFHAAM